MESTIHLNAKYIFTTRWEKFLHIVPLKRSYKVLKSSQGACAVLTRDSA